LSFNRRANGDNDRPVLTGIHDVYWVANLDRLFKLGLATALIAYGLIAVNSSALNFYNDPSADERSSLVHAFQNAALPRRDLFLIINCSLWLLSWFEWRAALIAFCS